VGDAQSGVWKLITANVGDSRILASRAGVGEQLTEDHKPVLEKERERIRNAGGWVSGNRVDGMLSVSRSFGDSFFKSSPQGERYHKVIAVPDITEPEPLRPGDKLFFCCDGVFEAGMTTQQVVDTHAAAQSPRGHSGPRAVVTSALDQGSQDNVTCLVVTLGQIPPPKEVALVKYGTGAGSRQNSRQSSEVKIGAHSSPDLQETPLGQRAGRWERGGYDDYVAERLAVSSGLVASRHGSGPSSGHFAQSPPRHARPTKRGDGAASPDQDWEGRNHHIVTLQRGEDFLGSAAASAGSMSMSGTYNWAAVDGGGQGWCTREGGCASGIVLIGEGDNWRRVREVRRDSPAWKAGVRSGMDVISVDGKTVSCVDAYEGAMRKGRETIELIIRSDAATWALIRRRQALHARTPSPCPPAPAPLTPFTQTIGGMRHKALENLQSAYGGGRPQGLKRGSRDYGHQPGRRVGRVPSANLGLTSAGLRESGKMKPRPFQGTPSRQGLRRNSDPPGAKTPPTSAVPQRSASRRPQRRGSRDVMSSASRDVLSTTSTDR